MYLTKVLNELEKGNYDIDLRLVDVGIQDIFNRIYEDKVKEEV